MCNIADPTKVGLFQNHELCEQFVPETSRATFYTFLIVLALENSPRDIVKCFHN